MGKNKNRKRKKNKGASPQENEKKKSAAAPPPKKLSTPSAASLPLAFPSGLDVPTNSFLRNEEPYQQSFQTALDTCYEGFAVDNNGSVPAKEETVQNALNQLEKLGFFRTDVTQPFGLGTKCAKTYVTRCLLGDKGTTYKYLGLRMFSHPWNDDTASNDDAVQVIHQLNETLTERTEHHLSELAEKRRKRGGGSTQGRAGFDICLVNRMEPSGDLKDEPSIGEGKCAVSWHADSSLEHYSTIAVYQTIVYDKKESDDQEWSVAMRVAHHAEGPEASRRGTDIQSTLVTDTPTVSVSLPSGSAYYLLDDFNHHHQHAVISEGGGSHNVRYSCTHRLLRYSHNVTHVLERCQKTCSLFHKKGTKIWRSEQVLLTEIESEWIRQFYIQGNQHKNLLWKHWGDSMQQLLRYWSQLEARTKQTIDFLQFAAEGRCGIDSLSDDHSKVDRKTRNKRKKALDTLEELISRIGMARTTAIQSLYEPLADLLRERAEMRRLWKKREDDHVFRELDRSQRPLPLPFQFDVDTKSSGDGSAVSPLPEDLLALDLVALGRACVSGDAKYLPADCKLTSSSGAQESSTELPKSVQNDHCQSLSWQGWNDRQFGLEMQSPWAGLLLQGRKTIETRAYDLPPALLGKRIDILQSKQGTTVSSLGNVVHIADEAPAVTRVGWCRFTAVIRYEDAAFFDADQDAHWVTKESDFYPFKKGSKNNVVYGWVVGEVGLATKDTSHFPLKTIVRRYRSLFELQFDNSNSKQADSVSASNNGKKKKKRRRY